jgi:hypothetical protein
MQDAMPGMKNPSIDNPKPTIQRLLISSIADLDQNSTFLTFKMLDIF